MEVTDKIDDIINSSSNSRETNKLLRELICKVSVDFPMWIEESKYKWVKFDKYVDINESCYDYKTEQLFEEFLKDYNFDSK